MEEIIKQIEEYQINNNKKWDELMERPTNEMQIPMAQLIGAMQSQIEYIKNELKIKQYGK